MSRLNSKVVEIEIDAETLRDVLRECWDLPEGSEVIFRSKNNKLESVTLIHETKAFNVYDEDEEYTSFENEASVSEF